MKRIAMSHLDVGVNEHLSFYLEKNGYNVISVEEINEDNIETVDVLINGLFEMNEFEAEDDTERTLKELEDEIGGLYKINQMIVKNMIKKKHGQLLFLFNTGGLSNFGMKSSPVLTHAKLSMMKSLAKELSAFKLYCSGVTFAFNEYTDFGSNDKKDIKEILDVFGSKKKIIELSDQFPLVLFMIENGLLFSGQNICIGVGNTISI